MGEVCRFCGEGIMLHPKVYVYICDYCGYAYQIDPASKTTIRVLRKPFARGS